MRGRGNLPRCDREGGMCCSKEKGRFAIPSLFICYINTYRGCLVPEHALMLLLNTLSGYIYLPVFFYCVITPHPLYHTPHIRCIIHPPLDRNRVHKNILFLN
eukprot:GHVO01045091.1.p1 GENE.GHVO01045091.1~~GHVO01045091.1.p1  ORF type:complete len:102 (-),score=7.30 GHVO01045091.1:34-339(-)